MLGKQEDQEPARSTRSTGSVKLARHRYIVCHRPRSSIYYLRHPPKEPPLPLGICCYCIKKEQQCKHLPPLLVITIYKIYYYYHVCAYKHKKPCATTPVKLPLWLAYPRY